MSESNKRLEIISRIRLGMGKKNLKTYQQLADACNIDISRLSKAMAPNGPAISHGTLIAIDQLLNIGLVPSGQNTAAESLGAYSKLAAERNFCGMYKAILPINQDFSVFSMYNVELSWDDELPGVTWLESGRTDWKNLNGVLQQYETLNIYYFVSHSRGGSGLRVIFSCLTSERDFIGFLATTAYFEGPGRPMVTPIVLCRKGFPDVTGKFDPSNEEVFSFCKTKIESVLTSQQVRFVLPLKL